MMKATRDSHRGTVSQRPSRNSLMKVVVKPLNSTLKHLGLSELAGDFSSCWSLSLINSVPVTMDSSFRFRDFPGPSRTRGNRQFSHRPKLHWFLCLWPRTHIVGNCELFSLNAYWSYSRHFLHVRMVSTGRADILESTTMPPIGNCIGTHRTGGHH